MEVVTNSKERKQERKRKLRKEKERLPFLLLALPHKFQIFCCKTGVSGNSALKGSDDGVLGLLRLGDFRYSE
jgi:hypothetical protein